VRRGNEGTGEQKKRNVAVHSHLIAYAGLIALLTITPGATTMLIARSVIARGQNAGFAVILGGSVGVYVHAMLSAVGLSLILVRSAQLFEVVKLLGALYLMFLGAQSIRRGLRAPQSLDGSTGRSPGAHSFTEGLVTILLSPETSLFYLTMLPQFFNPGESVLIESLYLATIHALVRIAWYSVLTVFLGRMMVMLRQPRVRQSLELVSGTALVGLGVKIATVRR
jgi:threonine/homoserine/homoserine lactone efflux protein